MISLANANTKLNNNSSAVKIGSKGKTATLSQNQVMLLAIAFGLTAFAVVVLSAVWTYVVSHTL